MRRLLVDEIAACEESLIALPVRKRVNWLVDKAFLETRMEEVSQNPGHIHHYIFTDSDIAVVDDLGHIFHDYQNFHLALTFRNNKKQPLNSGFIAVRGTPDGILRAKTFLQDVLKVYRSRYMKASRMLGDQLALAWVVKSRSSFDPKKFTKAQAFVEEDIGGAAVLFLPCAIYNWTPPEGAGQFHGMPLDVKVIHFKGSRKRLMLESWNFFSASSDISDMLRLILKWENKVQFLIKSFLFTRVRVVPITNSIELSADLFQRRKYYFLPLKTNGSTMRPLSHQYGNGGCIKCYFMRAEWI